MEVALIILGAIVAVGAACLLYEFYCRRSGKATDPQPAEAAAGECCGQHAVCERDSLLAAMSEKIEYFDDEELDAYAGRDSAQYSESESEEFRSVLLTLLPDDVAPWARSLQLRGIELPADVRDELLMIVGENRHTR
ncbi:MAG: phospholipase [Muribaculaceae bacterium]|nr:phospholipase [Muribaculaceae bacterium]